MREPEIVLGRDPQAGIPIEDRTLSRKHCRVYAGPDGWRVTDMGSRNGTYLNGTPILDDRLSEGDRDRARRDEDRRLPARGGRRGAPAARAHVRQARGPGPRQRDALLHEGDVRGTRGMVDRNREIRALSQLMELNEKINALSDEDELLEGVLDAAIELTRRGPRVPAAQAGGPLHGAPGAAPGPPRPRRPRRLRVPWAWPRR